jgi:hypothetical protein
VDAAQINTNWITILNAEPAAVGAAVFTGSGLDDATFGGTYTGTTDKTFRVKIDGTGAPDTFTWSDDGGSTWQATGVLITGAAQSLGDGVTVTFGSTTLHTLDDYWDSACTYDRRPSLHYTLSATPIVAIKGTPGNRFAYDLDYVIDLLGTTESKRRIELGILWTDDNDSKITTLITTLYPIKSDQDSWSEAMIDQRKNLFGV